MKKEPKAKRITQALTTAQKARLNEQRQRIAAELPDLAHRDQMCKEAQDEPTLSGELRRAIHASRLPLSEIAARSRIPALALDEFLTGERTLRSDVLDRLASGLNLELTSRNPV